LAVALNHPLQIHLAVALNHPLQIHLAVALNHPQQIPIHLSNDVGGLAFRYRCPTCIKWVVTH
jgi:hypothetical protein